MIQETKFTEFFPLETVINTKLYHTNIFYIIYIYRKILSHNQYMI